MSGYHVDTDWIFDVLHGQSAAVETLVNLAPHGLAVSVISYSGLYEGAYYSNRDPQVALAGLHTFLQGKDILSLTPAIAERFAILRGGLPRQL